MSRNIDKRRFIHRFVSMIMLLITVSFSARSDATEQLDSTDNVTIKTWLSDASNHNNSNDKNENFYAVNQQVILYIEVVTPRWFTGGTRISSIEIPNVAVKQRNQLATNFTERISGITWTHQRWEVTLYPQIEGTFVIPPTAVKVQVSREGAGNVSGVLYTEPQRFTAITPSGLLSENDDWVSGRDFTVEQEWITSNEELKAGDAITRSLTIKGADTLAMLMPELIKPISTRDYQTYTQPNQLIDTQTRGDYLSERKESAVYVVQNGGEVTFPSVKLIWWDTDTQQLKTIELDGKSFIVAHTFSSWSHQYWKALIVTLSITLILLLVIIKTIRYYQTHPLPTWLVYSKAVKKQQWSKVRVLLYRALREKNNQLELKQYRSAAEWKQYSSRFQTVNITTSLSRSLWRAVSQRLSGLHSILSKLKPADVLPQLHKQRIRYGNTQNNQHRDNE